MSRNDNSATHEGLFNTNTSCNFTEHSALKCQVSNSCNRSRRVSGLADSIDVSRGVNNMFCALMRELDNGNIYTCHTESNQVSMMANCMNLTVPQFQLV